MPLARHPLVFPYNTREPNAFIGLAAAKDNRMIGVIPQIVDDPIKGEKAAYAAKRLGLVATDTPAAGSYGGAVFNGTQKITAYASAATLAGATIYHETTNCGAVGASEFVNQIIEVSRSGVTYYMITASEAASLGSGYFLASDSVSDSTFSGDTHTNTVIDNITGLTDTLYPGQPISGTGIQAGTRIATVTSATAITTTIATTGTATVTITKTHLAKIIDADFPTTIVGSFVDMDGYLFVMDGSANVWNSDLNSIYSWSASSFIPANIKSGAARGCAKRGNLLCALKSFSIEFFRNAGNPFGSVLSRADTQYVNFGVKGSKSRAAVVTELEGILYIIGNGQDGRTGIYEMRGTVPTHISTPFIDSLIPNTSADYAYLSGNASQAQKILYLNGGLSDSLYGGTGGIAFYPDWGITTETGFPFDFIQHGGVFVSRSTTTGKTYAQQTTSSTPTYQDDSANFDSVLQFDGGDKGSGNIKTVKYYELIGDTFTAGTATLSYSDDDCQNFTAFPQTFDLTAAVKRIYPGGSYTGRRFLKLTVTGANRAWRGRFIDENYTVGAE